MGQYGGWEESNFGTMCEKLKRANAQLAIIGMAVVLGDQSIGWASLSVKDKDLSIITNDFSSHVTIINGDASQNKADELMVAAINNAAQKWEDLDRALAALDRERDKIKRNRSR